MPTAVEPIEVDAPFDLWVKRDDHTSIDYGGNKARKLEFLLADAKEQGHTEVWTVGAIGSHHVLATCIHAEKVGLHRGALHYPQPVTAHVRRNLLALSTTKPTLKLLTDTLGLPGEMLKQKISEWSNTTPDVYYIPGGGSSPVGALGYVNAALEFVAQIEAGICPKPDAIYVAAGTCGTLAGLLVGLQLAGMRIPVFGVRVVDLIVSNAALTHALAHRTTRLLEKHDVPASRAMIESDVNFIHDAFGADYGVATEEGLAAVEAMRGTLNLEPTYTAKTFAAMLRHAPKHNFGSVLYWHTLSGADLSDRVAKASPSDLPPEYGQFFDDD